MKRINFVSFLIISSFVEVSYASISSVHLHMLLQIGGFETENELEMHSESPDLEETRSFGFSSKSQKKKNRKKHLRNLKKAFLSEVDSEKSSNDKQDNSIEAEPELILQAPDYIKQTNPFPALISINQVLQQAKTKEQLPDGSMQFLQDFLLYFGDIGYWRTMHTSRDYDPLDYFKRINQFLFEIERLEVMLHPKHFEHLFLACEARYQVVSATLQSKVTS